MIAALILIGAFNGFDTHKTGIKAFILEHLQSHPDCESRQILDVVDSVEIISQFHNDHLVRGWVHEGKVYINTNKRVKQTPEKIVYLLIHELLHICGRCLNDSIRSDEPICVLFDRKIHHSMDIVKAIKEHFKAPKI